MFIISFNIFYSLASSVYLALLIKTIYYNTQLMQLYDIYIAIDACNTILSHVYAYVI